MSISAAEQTRINNLAEWQDEHMDEVINQIVNRSDEELEQIIKESAELERATGKKPQFESFEEFDRLMMSDEAFKL